MNIGKIFSLQNIIILILSIILSLVLFKQCENNRIYEDNYIVLSDSINNYRDKIGNLYKEKESYILEIDNLKRINENLYAEVKNLKDNPTVVTQVITEFKFDTIIIDNVTETDTLNNKINTYKYADNFINMDITHILSNNKGKIEINNISSTANIYTSIIENKKTRRLSIISRSDNPYLTINNVNGGFLDINSSKTLTNYFKRENKWAITVQGGLGIVYDMQSQKLIGGPGFSVGVSRIIFQW